MKSLIHSSMPVFMVLFVTSLSLSSLVNYWPKQDSAWFQGSHEVQKSLTLQVSTKANVGRTDRLAHQPGVLNDIHSHQLWDEVLKAYVADNGMVNYAAIKKEPSKLDHYLSLLQQNPVEDNWSRSQKLAYWINAYNAFTVKLIIDNYPVNSIRDIDRPWGKKFIQLGDENYSLNHIEHDIIRPTFQEPRIHFALVCAAVSCPKLLNRAYLPESLDQQLDQQTRYFINESGKNEITNNQVRISKLFNWYQKDFTTKGTLSDFLDQYTNLTVSPSAKIDYLEYNWDLNDSMMSK